MEIVLTLAIRGHQVASLSFAIIIVLLINYLLNNLHLMSQIEIPTKFFYKLKLDVTNLQVNVIENN